MSDRVKLPNGVPADNRSLAGGSGDYSAPDMATPKFARPDEAARTAFRRVERREIEIIEEDDEDESKILDEDRDEIGPPPEFRSMTLFIALGALLAALAAVVVANGNKPTPLCSEQPAWNQYNCRAG